MPLTSTTTTSREGRTGAGHFPPKCPSWYTRPMVFSVVPSQKEPFHLFASEKKNVSRRIQVEQYKVYLNAVKREVLVAGEAAIGTFHKTRTAILTTNERRWTLPVVLQLRRRGT